MKSKKWLFSCFSLLIFTLVPAMNSKAFSSIESKNETNCHTLRFISIQDLDTQQKNLILQCDLQEADQSWQEQYGNLNNSEIMSGIVHDPL